MEREDFIIHIGRNKVKKKSIARAGAHLFAALFLTGCSLWNGNLWEDAKTSARYIQRAGQSLVGDVQESKLVANQWEFYASSEEDFIPVEENDLHNTPSTTKANQQGLMQAKKLPANAKGQKPTSSDFLSPAGQLASIFTTLHFATDEHVLYKQESIDALKKMAIYLKRNPNMYLFIEGHCDKRASEAYNLALGTRRANFIRQFLIKEGIEADRLFTVSHGKERPIDFRDHKDAFAKNRRVEFKIYQV